MTKYIILLNFVNIYFYVFGNKRQERFDGRYHCGDNENGEGNG